MESICDAPSHVSLVCPRTFTDSVCAFTQMARKELAPGIGRLSRSQVYARRQLYKGRKTGTAPAKPETAPTKEVQVKGSKNGGSRLVPTSKAPRFYPAEDVRKPKQSRKAVKPTKLRDSIDPGTVLILLAGRFRGKRVVFLKQLESGLLLVTGPYKVNGVPLRRVNQAYVIATSTKIDLGDYKVRTRSRFCGGMTCSGWPLQTDAKFTDSYFSKSEKKRTRSAENEFFEDGKPKEKDSFPESKAADQREVDKVVVAAVKKTEYLAKYLKASWGLSKGEYPHQLVF
jgi:large subunit ribosomal protein L6e